MVSELQRLDDVKANIERLNPLVDACSHWSQTLGRLVSSIENYFTEGLSGFSGAITLYKGPSPSPQKREAPVEAVERCRRRYRELEADRHRIMCSPWHAAGAKLRARAEIEKLAERGRPSVLPLIETAEETIAWRERLFSDVHMGNGQLVTAVGDPQALPLLFWLHKEALIQRIEAEIDAVSDDGAALTAQDRKKQLETIDRDRLALQREEDHWVSVAIEAGVAVLRRPEADPRAVLGLGDDMPAPEVA